MEEHSNLAASDGIQYILAAPYSPKEIRQPSTSPVSE